MVNGAPSRQVRGYFCHKEETPNSTLHPYYIHGHQLKHVDHSKGRRSQLKISHNSHRIACD